MADAGWYPDPTGRFGQRWYDGSTWTDHAVGANGGVIDDALPESDTPLPPPVPPQPAAQPFGAQQFGAQQFGAQQFGAQQFAGGYQPQGAEQHGAAAVRYGTGAGLIIGLVGMVLVALSLFAIKWTKIDKSRFTDLSSALRKEHPTSFADVGEHLFYVYGAWLGFALFAAVLVLTVLAGIPVPRTGPGNRFWRIGASLLAGIAAVLHTMTITYVFTNSGQTAGAGSLLGLFGYVLVMVAMIFGARRIVSVPGRPR